jgi:hypothetical protein
MLPDLQKILQALPQVKALSDELGKEKAVLRLSKQFSRDEIAFLMDQLQGQAVAEEKFPSLSGGPGILFPPSFYLEQTSSEITAVFKSSLVHGDTLVDMTGGFGIDTFFFSKKIKNTFYVEQDPQIYAVAKHNLELLNPHIKTACGDSLEFISTMEFRANWLYLDPIRRNKHRRLTRLEDYSPNVPQVMDRLFQHADHVMIKLWPMLDITQVCRDLAYGVYAVYVVSVDNECRELLFLCDGRTHDNPEVICINFRKGREEKFSSVLYPQQVFIPVSDPLQYLYEPNSSIFKAHKYDELASKYGLHKLHSNTHVYTSSIYHADYEGAVYEITGQSPLDVKSFRTFHPHASYNIKARNVPLKPAEIAKKLGIKEGGDAYLFCVRMADEKLKLISCKKLPSGMQAGPVF